MDFHGRLFIVIASCYMAAVVAGVLGGLYRWNQLNIMMKLSVSFILYTLLQESTSLLLSPGNRSAAFLMPLFSVAEVTIPICCYLALRGWLNWRSAFVSIAFSLVVVLVRYNCFNTDRAGSYFLAVEQFIFSIVAAHALYRIMISEEVIVWRDPVFAFWTAQLIGCAGTYMLFSISPIAQEHKGLLNNIKLLNVVINTLIYGFMAYSILVMPSRKQRS